jgi:hypothetical protein
MIFPGFSVEDIARKDIFENQYDIAVFASGYEERSTFVPSHLDKSKIEKNIIIGFKGDTSEKRKINDNFYSNGWGGVTHELETSSWFEAFEILKQTFESITKDSIKILVDYSSMPRYWYLAVLLYVKYNEVAKNIVIDFIYSIGVHDKIVSNQLSEPVCLPDCDAGAANSDKTVTVFGLGFNQGAPHCILDSLEPDEVYAILTDPAARDDYPQRAYTSNEAFIKAHVKKERLVRLPLFSVNSFTINLREMIAPYIGEAEVCLVPFGPKPHVLGSIIMSMSCPEVSCLYSNCESNSVSVVSTGEFVMTRVSVPSKDF